MSIMLHHFVDQRQHMNRRFFVRVNLSNGVDYFLETIRLDNDLDPLFFDFLDLPDGSDGRMRFFQRSKSSDAARRKGTAVIRTDVSGTCFRKSLPDGIGMGERNVDDEVIVGEFHTML